MLKKNLVFAFRNLKKNKLSTAIHIMGLAIGAAACLVIFLFVQHEKSFDRYHQNADRIYRVVRTDHTASGPVYEGNVPYPLAPAFRNDFPELEQVARIHQEVGAQVAVGSEDIYEEDLMFAEPQLMKIFDFQTLAGDPLSVLEQPRQAVLTRSTAEKYFGSADPLGENLRINDTLNVTIGAVVADFPSNTHLRGSMLVSFESFADLMVFDPESWGVTIAGSAYVLLPENMQTREIENHLDEFVAKYHDDPPNTVSYALQPLSEIKFDTRYGASGMGQPMQARYLWIFAIIGGLILLIAGINFVNLSTAQSIKRAREIGVRKVVGARRTHLIAQYLCEAVVIAFFAIAAAVFLVDLGLPLLHRWLDLPVQASQLAQPAIIGGLLLTVLLLGGLSGLYPALVISRFKPAAALKTQVFSGARQFGLRQVLVTLQFVISILLVVGTLVVSHQLQYSRTKDLGFNKEATIILSVPEPEKMATLKNEWSQLANVSAVSGALGAPISENNIHTTFTSNSLDESESLPVLIKPADHTYLETYGVSLTAGRWYTENEARQGAFDIPREDRIYYFVVNETLARTIGFANPNEALNKELGLGLNGIRARVVGVVNDFHTSSLHEAIEPLIFLSFPRFYYEAGLKVNMNDLPATLSQVEASWRRQFPARMFSYQFLDESLERLYESEVRLFSLFKIFAGLAIFIACLGLWGLVAFITEQRTKEIGVRKVLGASISHIVWQIYREFALLIGLAFVIATPFAYWGALRWLQNFSYHFSPKAGLFVVAGLLVLVVALVTVSYKAIRAALANPIKSLRYE